MGLRVISIGDFGNYVGDSEAVKYLQNNEETQGYEELQNQTDVAAFKVPAKDQLLRDIKGAIPRTFKQPQRKIQGDSKSTDGFKKMKATVEQKGERKKMVEEKKARLAKVWVG